MLDRVQIAPQVRGEAERVREILERVQAFEQRRVDQSGKVVRCGANLPGELRQACVERVDQQRELRSQHRDAAGFFVQFVRIGQEIIDIAGTPRWRGALFFDPPHSRLDGVRH